ncbi:MAG: PAS domain S-box protein, partial [Actinomycetota bacterium]
SSADAIIGEDLDGIVTSWNPAAERLYGWTAQEAIGRPAAELAPPAQRAQLVRIRERLERGEHIPPFESERIRKDGAPFLASIRVSPVFGVHGEIVGSSKIVRDITESKRTEQALRRSEAQYHALADGIPQLVWQADAEGAVQYCNLRWLEYTGLSPDEVLGWGWARALHPDDLQATRERWEAAAPTGETYEAEYRLRGRDGRYRWFLDRGIPVRDESGAIIQWVGTCTDIEVRKQAQLAQSQLAAIIEASEDAIISATREGVVQTWNLGAERTLGYLSAEMVGKPLSLLAAPAFAAEQLALMERVLAGEPVRGVTAAYLRKDGGLIELSQTLSPIRDAEGGVIGISSISRDLTEQQRLHAERAALLARLRLYLSRSPIGCLVTGPDGRIQEWNAAAEAILGYSESEAVGRTIDELGLVSESARAHVEHIRARLRAGDMTAHCADENVTKDGRSIFCEWYNTPLQGPDGAYGGSLSMFVDITEKRRLEAQLRHTQKMEGIGQLAGGIAHDFNNMLAVICGYTEMVLGMLPGAHPVRGNLLEVQKAADRAAALTRQLLAFSRKQLLAPKVLDLNQVVLELDTMLRRLIGEDVELVTVTEPAPAWVKADPSQLEQVLVNLVVNARDAMPHGGVLRLSTEQVHVDAAFAARNPGVEPGAYVRLSVRDTGCGMDAATMGRVFEPFFTTKEVGKGTGLGLPTVYGVVTQSGGCVNVESAVGLGSTFHVYLPRVSAPAGVDDRVVAPILPTGNETILVVEDEAMVRALVVEVLRSTGYAVLEATQGDEALQLVDQHQGPIHLLLTDVVMPRMSGPKLAESVLRRRPRAAVLFMSGYSDDALVRSGEQAADVELLPKPFGPRMLAERVRRVLDKQRSKDARGVILVVDDAAEERELLAEVLRQQGYVALTAADGREALVLLQDSPTPDLIVFDLVMPGMNGWVFRQELLKNPALRDIPAVAISGQVAPGGSEYLSVAGTLCKPFQASELIQLVQRCLLPPAPR